MMSDDSADSVGSVGSVGSADSVGFICPDITIRRRIDRHVDVICFRDGNVILYYKDGSSVVFRSVSKDEFIERQREE